MTSIEAFYRYSMMRRQSTLAAYARLMSNAHTAASAGDSSSTQPEPPTPPANNKLELVVETTADYKKSGIYSAERDDASKPIVIDWGDGTIEEIDGDISQKVHEYATVGAFNVTMENIKSYAASANDYAWYDTTSQNAYTLKEVVAMPDSVKSIGSEAFSQCYGLMSVTIGNNVMSIGAQVFHYCTSLTNVMIPNSVTSIGIEAFSFCNSLTNMTISNSVTIIQNFAFFNCTSLASVTIGNGIKSIEVNAFGNCTGLTNVTIPDSVTSIQEWAFVNCSKLTSVTITANDGDAQNVKQMMIDAGVSEDIEWHMGS